MCPDKILHFSAFMARSAHVTQLLTSGLLSRSYWMKQLGLSCKTQLDSVRVTGLAKVFALFLSSSPCLKHRFSFGDGASTFLKMAA